MKIEEVVKRECCDWKDLKPYMGDRLSKPRTRELSFCVHCGQLWREYTIGEYPNSRREKDRVMAQS